MFLQRLRSTPDFNAAAYFNGSDQLEPTSRGPGLKFERSRFGDRTREGRRPRARRLAPRGRNMRKVATPALGVRGISFGEFFKSDIQTYAV
jgi:hypothetical protein